MVGNTEDKRPFRPRRSSPPTELTMTILSHTNLRFASRLLLTVGAAGLLAACSSEPEQPKGPTPEEIAKEAQGAFVASVPGVYEGVLPCADCSGIRTELYVRAKGSYTRVSHYEGKEGSWEEAGVWRVEFAPDAQTIEAPPLPFTTCGHLRAGSLGRHGLEGSSAGSRPAASRPRRKARRRGACRRLRSAQKLTEPSAKTACGNAGMDLAEAVKCSGMRPEKGTFSRFVKGKVPSIRSTGDKKAEASPASAGRLRPGESRDRSHKSCIGQKRFCVFAKSVWEETYTTFGCVPAASFIGRARASRAFASGDGLS